MPIDDAFYRHHISGRHNPEIAADLFPDWPEDRRTAFYMEKEQRFRDMAGRNIVINRARYMKRESARHLQHASMVSFRMTAEALMYQLRTPVVGSH